MSFKLIAISAVLTALSFVAVQFGSDLSFSKLISGEIVGKNLIYWDKENANHVIELFLGSNTTIWLLASFVIHAFIFLNICLKVCLLCERINCLLNGHTLFIDVIHVNFVLCSILLT